MAKERTRRRGAVKGDHRSPASVWLAPLLDALVRGGDLAARLGAQCKCRDDGDEELGRIQRALHDGYRSVLAIAQGSESPAKALPGAIRVVDALARALLVAEKNAPDHPPALIAPKALFFGYVAFEVPPTPAPPEPPLDEEAARKLLEALKKALEEAIEELRKLGGDNKAEIDALRNLLRQVITLLGRLGKAGRVTLRQLLSLIFRLLEELPGLLRALFRRVGGRIMSAIISAIVEFLRDIGTALGAAAEDALLVGAGATLAVIAAFIAGLALGWWIGTRKIDGETTVHDFIAEGLYLQYFAPPDDCDDLWAAYLKARSERRAYESSGPTLDKSVMIPLLAREFAILKKYLDKPCDLDTGHVLHRELARLQANLQRLLR